jgi:hypothetical protein
VISGRSVPQRVPFEFRRKLGFSIESAVVDADVRAVRSTRVGRREARAHPRRAARLLRIPDRRARQGKRDLALLHLVGSATERCPLGTFLSRQRTIGAERGTAKTANGSPFYGIPSPAFAPLTPSTTAGSGQSGRSENKKTALWRGFRSSLPDSNRRPLPYHQCAGELPPVGCCAESAASRPFHGRVRSRCYPASLSSASSLLPWWWGRPVSLATVPDYGH